MRRPTAHTAGAGTRGPAAFAAEGPSPEAQPGAAKTYVLVHGAWHGGWCWREVAETLRSQGHRVFTPTQTGLGERRHLLSRDITLDVFVDDIANLMEAEELRDAILVGHSFGGCVISGVADRMPEAVRHLVYLDSQILEPGQIAFEVMPADVVAVRRKLAAEQGGGVAIPPPTLEALSAAFGIPADSPELVWVSRRVTPHPLGTYESPLRLKNAVGNGRPCTYIACTAPFYAPLERARQWARRQSGWRWQEIATGHDAMVTAPAELARMLLAVA